MTITKEQVQEWRREAGVFADQNHEVHGSWVYANDYKLCELAAAHSRNKTIEQVLNCYSPDDSATDWSNKIKELKWPM